MAEEHKCQEQPSNIHLLCANNCGFFGSPTTLNLCSNCYRLNEQQISTAKLTLTPPESSFSSVAAAAAVPDSVFPDSNPSELNPAIPILPISIPATGDELRQPNRCGSCRKRVGLTGFTCRCGTTFCGAHRYPEKHECSFDFKTAGKEAIARANPVVKAAKLEKI